MAGAGVGLGATGRAVGVVGCRGGAGDCWEAAGMGRMAGAAANGCSWGEEKGSVGCVGGGGAGCWFFFTLKAYAISPRGITIFP